MKKIMVLSGLALAVSALGLGAFGCFENVQEAKGTFVQERKEATKASDWVLSNGDASLLSATSITGGVSIESLHAFTADMRTVDKLALDGLSFTFQNSGTCTDQYNKGMGFYFSTGTGHSFSGPVFTLWHQPFDATQTRLRIGSDHDYTANNSLAYNSMDAENPTGLHSALTLVMNSTTDIPNDGLSVSFEKVDASWWKVVITEIFQQCFWGDNL